MRNQILSKMAGLLSWQTQIFVDALCPLPGAKKTKNKTKIRKGTDIYIYI